MLAGLWCLVIIAFVIYRWVVGAFLIIFYDTNNLGWAINSNATDFQYTFDWYWWTIAMWFDVGAACLLYIISYIKLRWLKAQMFEQQDNAQKNVEFRLLILCAVTTVQS